MKNGRLEEVEKKNLVFSLTIIVPRTKSERKLEIYFLTCLAFPT